MSGKKHLLVLCSLFAAVMMIVSLGGCAKKAVTAGASGISPDSDTVGEAKTAAKSGAAVTSGSADSGSASAGEGKAVAAGSGTDRGQVTVYTVKRGDSLWWIAKYKDVYDDAFLWPIIYNANKDQIKNPNLIHPGQKLKIPRSGISKDEITKARKQAGAKKPYTPPKGSKPPVN